QCKNNALLFRPRPNNLHEYLGLKKLFSPYDCQDGSRLTMNKPVWALQRSLDHIGIQANTKTIEQGGLKGATATVFLKIACKNS
ncbi:unnamed protein product, partial [Ceratitis capitata]